MNFWQNRRRIATLRKGQSTTVTVGSNLYTVSRFNRFYIEKVDSDWNYSVGGVEEAIESIYKECSVKQTV